MQPLSPRQAYLADLGQRSARFVIAFGPTRSGKTFAALDGFLEWAGRAFSGATFALAVKSRDRLSEPMLREIRAWCRRRGLKLSPHAEGGWTIPARNGGRNRFMPVIAVDGEDRAEERARGAAYAGVFADEFNVMPERFLLQLMNRMLETTGSKMVMTANPAGRSHWGYAHWAKRADDGEIDGEHHAFAITDNPSLSVEQVVQLAEAYPPGPMFDRMILGRHTDAGGLIHQVAPDGWVKFDPAKTPPLRLEVGIDWASHGVTAAVMVAYVARGWHIIDELHHDGRVEGTKSIKQQAQLLMQWAAGRNVATWAVPHDAQGLAEELKDLHDRARIGTRVVWPCYDRVLDGINILNRRLHGSGRKEMRLLVDPACTELGVEWSGYAWSRDAAAKGEDRPDKESGNGAHLSDAARYWAGTAEMSERGETWT